MASDASNFTGDPAPLDPVAAAHVDAALAPYEDLLPADVLADFREFVGDALTMHDVAALLVSRTRERAPVLGSGERVREGALVGATDKTTDNVSNKEKVGGGKR